MIIVMTESSDQERESIRKEAGKFEDERKDVVVASPEVGEEEKPSVIDYKSENRPALTKTKIDHAEITSRQENLQKNYKTPEQVLDEDYKVAPTSTDKEKVRSDKKT
jgi:hypothetical protein